MIEEVLEEAQRCAREPFTWGTNDCATLWADAVWVMCGRDVLAGLRGRYWDARSALWVLRRTGFSSVEDLVTARCEKISVLAVSRGDLVLAGAEGPLSSPALVIGGGMALSRDETGPVGVSRASWRRAWRGGRG